MAGEEIIIPIKAKLEIDTTSGKAALESLRQEGKRISEAAKSNYSAVSSAPEDTRLEALQGATANTASSVFALEQAKALALQSSNITDKGKEQLGKQFDRLIKAQFDAMAKGIESLYASSGQSFSREEIARGIDTARRGVDQLILDHINGALGSVRPRSAQATALQQLSDRYTAVTEAPTSTTPSGPTTGAGPRISAASTGSTTRTRAVADIDTSNVPENVPASSRVAAAQEQELAAQRKAALEARQATEARAENERKAALTVGELTEEEQRGFITVKNTTELRDGIAKRLRAYGQLFSETGNPYGDSGSILGQQTADELNLKGGAGTAAGAGLPGFFIQSRKPNQIRDLIGDPEKLGEAVDNYIRSAGGAVKAAALLMVQTEEQANDRVAQAKAQEQKDTEDAAQKRAPKRGLRQTQDDLFYSPDLTVEQLSSLTSAGRKRIADLYGVTGTGPAEEVSNSIVAAQNALKAVGNRTGANPAEDFSPQSLDTLLRSLERSGAGLSPEEKGRALIRALNQFKQNFEAGYDKAFTAAVSDKSLSDVQLGERTDRFRTRFANLTGAFQGGVSPEELQGFVQRAEQANSAANAAHGQAQQAKAVQEEDKVDTAVQERQVQHIVSEANQARIEAARARQTAAKAALQKAKEELQSLVESPTSSAAERVAAEENIKQLRTAQAAATREYNTAVKNAREEAAFTGPAPSGTSTSTVGIASSETIAGQVGRANAFGAEFETNITAAIARIEAANRSNLRPYQNESDVAALLKNSAAFTSTSAEERFYSALSSFKNINADIVRQLVEAEREKSKPSNLKPDEDVPTQSPEQIQKASAELKSAIDKLAETVRGGGAGAGSGGGSGGGGGTPPPFPPLPPSPPPFPSDNNAKIAEAQQAAQTRVDSQRKARLVDYFTQQATTDSDIQVDAYNRVGAARQRRLRDIYEGQQFTPEDATQQGFLANLQRRNQAQTGIATEQAFIGDTATTALVAQQANLKRERVALEQKAIAEETLTNGAVARTAEVQTQLLRVKEAQLAQVERDAQIDAGGRAQFTAAEADRLVRAKREQLQIAEQVAKQQAQPEFAGQAGATEEAQRQASAQKQIAFLTASQLPGGSLDQEIEAAKLKEVSNLKRRIAIAQETLDSDTHIAQLTAEQQVLQRQANQAVAEQAKLIIQQKVASGEIQGGTLFQRLISDQRARNGQFSLPDEAPTLGQFVSSKFSTTAGFLLSGSLLYGGFTQLKTAIDEAQKLQVILGQVQTAFKSTDQSADFPQFRSSILAISRDTGTAASEVAEVGLQFKGAFKDTTTAVEQTRAAIELAKVSGLDLKEITDSLTAVAVTYNTTISHIGDNALSLQESTGVLARQTIDFLGQIGPVAHDAGLSIEQIGAFAAVAQERSGRAGGAIAEGISRVIPTIENNTTKIVDLFGRLSRPPTIQFPVNGQLETRTLTQSLVEQQLAAGKTGDVLLELAASYNQLSPALQQYVVYTLGGKREAQNLLAVFGDYPDVLRAYQNQFNDGGKLTDYFTKQQQSLANTLQRLQTSFSQIGEALLRGGLGEALQVIGALMFGVIGVVRGLTEVLAFADKITAGWSGRIIGLLLAFRLLLPAVQAVLGATTGLTTAKIANTGATLAQASAEERNAGVLGGETAAEVADTGATGANTVARSLGAGAGAKSRILGSLGGDAGAALTGEEAALVAKGQGGIFSKTIGRVLGLGEVTAAGEAATGGAVAEGTTAISGGLLGSLGLGGLTGGAAIASAGATAGLTLALVGLGTALKIHGDKVAENTKQLESFNGKSDAELLGIIAKNPKDDRSLGDQIFGGNSTADAARIELAQHDITNRIAPLFAAISGKVTGVSPDTDKILNDLKSANFKTNSVNDAIIGFLQSGQQNQNKYGIQFDFSHVLGSIGPLKSSDYLGGKNINDVGLTDANGANIFTGIEGSHSKNLVDFIKSRRDALQRIADAEARGDVETARTLRDQNHIAPGTNAGTSAQELTAILEDIKKGKGIDALRPLLPPALQNLSKQALKFIADHAKEFGQILGTDARSIADIAKDYNRTADQQQQITQAVQDAQTIVDKYNIHDSSVTSSDYLIALKRLRDAANNDYKNYTGGNPDQQKQLAQEADKHNKDFSQFMQQLTTNALNDADVISSITGESTSAAAARKAQIALQAATSSGVQLSNDPELGHQLFTQFVQAKQKYYEAIGAAGATFKIPEELAAAEDRYNISQLLPLFGDVDTQAIKDQTGIDANSLYKILAAGKQAQKAVAAALHKKAVDLLTVAVFLHDDSIAKEAQAINDASNAIGAFSDSGTYTPTPRTGTEDAQTTEKNRTDAAKANADLAASLNPHNPVAQAQAQADAALAALNAAKAAGENNTKITQLQADYNKALTAVGDAENSTAKAMADAQANLYESLHPHDVLAAANAALQRAQASLNAAQTPDQVVAAQAEINKANQQILEAQDAQADSFGTLANSFFSNNELELTQAKVKQAKEKYDRAVARGYGIEEQNALRAAWVDAAFAAQQAQDKFAQELLDGAIALDNLRGDKVGAARDTLTKAKDIYQGLLAEHAGKLEVGAAYLNVISAQRAYNDSIISDAESNIDFQLQVKRITTQQAIAMYQGVLQEAKALNLGKDTIQQIQERIYQLQHDSQQDFQYNLPTDLTLPTLYEARRFDQTGGGYQDNRQISIVLNANTKLDAQQAINQITDAVNSSPRFGTRTRTY